MGADPLWIRHERPDGHRSLWCHVGRWFSMEGVTDGSPEPWTKWNNGVEMRDDALLAACERRSCPTPTPEDLAWLRGEA